MSYTPGPWKSFDNGHFHDVRASVDEGDENISETCPNVALVMQNDNYIHTNGRNREAANARLIAAAPEMLSALEDFINTVEHVDPGVYRDTIDNARNVIAKVRGEEKC